jgi:hypothetical protein
MVFLSGMKLSVHGVLSGMRLSDRGGLGEQLNRVCYILIST